MAAEEITLRDGNESCSLPLPPGVHHQFESHVTPVNSDGSFLYAVRLSRSKLSAPVDERTGIPLAIAPRSDLLSRPAESINEHHHWHPRLSPVLRTRGGRALRNSRIQRVEQRQHNYGHETSFHAVFQDGPEVPTDEETQLGLCVLALAHYLPDKVVDTSRGEPDVRDMKTWEMRRFSEPGRFLTPTPKQVKKYRDKWFPDAALSEAKEYLIVRRQKQSEFSYGNLYYGLDPLKDFIMQSVIEQDMSDVKSSLLQEFIHKENVQAGLSLLGIASIKASQAAMVKGQSLETVYKELYDEGRLHPQMPPKAAILLRYKLGDLAGRKMLLPAYRQHLLDWQQKAA